MPYRPFEDQNCSIARALGIVGERWSLLVLREVSLGHRRFAEIRRGTGIAPNILSDRLQTLVDHGVLERRELDDGHEYVATEKGRAVSPILSALMTWGDRYGWEDDPDHAGPPRVTVHTDCGHDAHPRLHCSHCGEPLAAGSTKVRPGPGATERQRGEGLLPA
jgi:DNA-binding HxlR family transcriptional regulator